MTAARPQLAPPPITNRTRVGTGAEILPGLDGRTGPARRYREIVADFVQHLGGEVTAAEEAVIRRAAQLQLWCEDAEAAFARGEAFDITSFTTAANALRRLLADLGLQRRARDVTPDLRDYIAGKHGVAS